MELLCIMAQSDDRGRLLVNGKAPAMPAIARMCCVDLAEAQALMGELRDNGVFSEVDGVVISRRMIRENERSETYRENAQKRWTKTGEEKKVTTIATTIPITTVGMGDCNANCNAISTAKPKQDDSDESFWDELSKLYTWIDLPKEKAKMQAWLLTPRGRGRKINRRFVVNWLNKLDKPMSDMGSNHGSTGLINTWHSGGDESMMKQAREAGFE
jgi:hypothetical protein